MALTITEKNHWKERIAQRNDKRINQIKCANPKIFQDIADKAKREAIRELQRHVEEELLLNHPLGREVTSLQNEKENLLDTVWLATSSREVTTLWEKALKLLGEQTTDFQREVLSERRPAES